MIDRLIRPYREGVGGGANRFRVGNESSWFVGLPEAINQHRFCQKRPTRTSQDSASDMAVNVAAPGILTPLLPVGIQGTGLRPTDRLKIVPQ